MQITPEPDPAQLPVPIDVPLLPVRRGFRWGTLFWAATGGLVLLGLGLGIVNLIEDLFARNDGLGGPPTTESTLMYDFNFGTPGVMFSPKWPTP